MDTWRKKLAGFRIAHAKSCCPVLLFASLIGAPHAHAQVAATNVTPTLSYSTYLGGSGFDYAYAVAVDSAGSAYIAGQTDSSNFPATGPTLGPGGGTCGSPTDSAPCSHVFVAKLNATGSSLVYATILGGSNEDHATSIAVDSSGDAYVTGYTASTDFPTQGAFQPTSAGGNCGSPSEPVACYHAFVAKLDPAGTRLVYSTFLGGTGNDLAASIAVDSAGAAYVTGSTSSPDFPVTSGAFQRTFGGGTYNAFITKLDATGSTAVYSTYLGGATEDHGAAIAVDSSGSAYVTGYTNSNNFPTMNPLQANLAVGACGSTPCFDAFAAKLNLTGSALIYSTYLGGSGGDYGYGIAVDQAGSVYLTGLTTSSDFPVTTGALQTAGGDTGYSSFVTKLDPSGSAAVFSTFLGGTANVSGWGIALDDSGNSYVTGQVYGSGFTTSSPLQPAANGLNDAFVAEVNDSGSELVFATYLGGSGNDVGKGISVDVAGNVYVAGGTFSPDFPTTPSAFQTAFGGGAYNAFVSRISLSSGPAVSLSSQRVSFGGQNVQTFSPPQNLVLTNLGTDTLLISQVTVSGDFEDDNTCGVSLAIGESCTLPVTFFPTATGMRTGELTITDNAAGSPHTVALSGMGTAPAVSFSASSLTFGDQGVTTTSGAQVLHVANTGSGPLSISNVSVTADFAQTNNCSGSSDPGSTCDISVVFAPSEIGPRTGLLTISDNASHSPQSIQLAGNGVVAFSLASSASAVTVVKGTDSSTFQVSASSTFGFTGVIELGCSGNASANCSFNPASISPGQSSTLSVTGLAPLSAYSLSFAVTGSSGASEASIPLAVMLSDFALTTSPASATIDAGQAQAYTLKLSPINDFSQSVSLSCAGAPPEATCNVSPAALTLDGSHDSPVTVTVSTTARSQLRQPRRGPLPGIGDLEPLQMSKLLLAFLMLAAMLSAARQQRKLWTSTGILFLALFIAACGGGASAGGGGGPSGTPAGTYTVTVTASTSSGPTHRVSLTLVVD